MEIDTFRIYLPHAFCPPLSLSLSLSVYLSLSLSLSEM